MKNVTVTKRATTADGSFKNTAYMYDADENTCAVRESAYGSSETQIYGFKFSIPTGAVINSMEYGIKASVSDSGKAFASVSLFWEDKRAKAGLEMPSGKNVGDEIKITSTSPVVMNKTYTGVQLQASLGGLHCVRPDADIDRRKE